jgi:hypothetical protein
VVPLEMGRSTLACAEDGPHIHVMTGWMLTEQADLFGLEIDVLTPEQAKELLDEADREHPSTDRIARGSAECNSTDLAPPERLELEGGPVPAAREYEFVCAGCFLIWHRRLLADERRHLCPDCADLNGGP